MRKFKPLRRASAKRLIKQRFIIYTEGANTEPDYFKQLSKVNFGSLVGVEIVPAAGVPLTIARNACARAKELAKEARRDSALRNDKVWAMFDRDTHPDVETALEMCRVAGVGTAFSDPCFELWLILHLENFDRPDNHQDVQRYLERLCPEYNRRGAKTANYHALIQKIKDAESRAKDQYNRRKLEGLCRPYTTVFELTMAIRSASTKHAESLIS